MIRRAPLLLLALAAVLAAFALSLAFGARSVSWAELWSGALHWAEPRSLAQAAVAARVPRAVLAALAGAALAVSGALMQGLTRNPLADPGLLGANAGAALMVVLALAWGWDLPEIWSAILGAALAAGAVYAVARLGAGGATPLKLALAGAALTAALSALTTALILPRGDVSGLAQAWLVGGVGGARFAQIAPILPFFALGGGAAALSAPLLNLLALGDETAAGLGARLGLARGLAGGGAVLLCAAATALCGPIGFVGLIVPHICRLILGVDYRLILPFSALFGAVLLLCADLAGRMIARPAEVEASIITALLGGPLFIWIVRRGRVGAL